MPTSDTPETPAASPAAPAAGSTPASGAPAEPYRFPNDPSKPQWMWGKTPDEVAGIAMQLNDALAAATAARPAAPAPSGPSLPTDDDFLRTPGQATQMAIQQVGGQMLQQAVGPMAEQIAGMARMMAQQTYADEFKRWGPEIETYISRVPPHQRTLDLYDGAVNLVRGKHHAELVEERAKAMLAQGGLSERGGESGGFAGTPNTGAVDFAKLPGGMGELAKRHGFTVPLLLENLKKMGMTPEQWMEQAMNQTVLSSVAPFSFQLNEEKLHATRQFS